MTPIKFKETEDNDLESTAYNNIFEPTFNNSYPPALPPMWEIADLCQLEEALTTT